MTDKVCGDELPALGEDMDVVFAEHDGLHYFNKSGVARSAALSVLCVHQHSPKWTIFDEMADCFRGLGQWENPVDRGLQRTFLQEFQESGAGCSDCFLAEEFEGEPADCRSLPYDVGYVDLCLASSGITGDHRRTAERERCQRFARQFSAHAVDDDIDTFAFGDTLMTGAGTLAWLERQDSNLGSRNQNP